MTEETGALGNNLFEDQPAQTTRAKRGARSEKGSDEWYSQRRWVRIEENPEIPPTGLSLAVNGEVVMLMPGEPVHLQNKYIEVLDHAIISVPQMDNAQRVVGTRQRHRFPYSFVEAPEKSA